MANLGPSIGWGLVVALSLVAGAVAAAVARLPERAAATLTAFGGGVLLAAVALELVPDADAEAGVALTVIGLAAGTLVYVGADAWLSRTASSQEMRRAMHASTAGRTGPAEEMMRADSTRGLSIAAGLFIDGVPESIALGLTIAEEELGIALLAGILIGNVVESYGAAQPIIAGGHRPGFAIRVLAGIGLALAVATMLGGTVLADASPEFIGTAQAVAAGAVLAVVSIAVIPHAFAEVSRRTATATVAGFLLGYVLS
ncbi:MAG: ZIP family metal transporter [Thermoleophilaceae bacterium]